MSITPNGAYTDAISILRFGAKVDGTTDDSDAFQAAIDSGETVYIPDGTMLAQNISIDADYISIRGPGATIKNAATDGTDLFVFATTGTCQFFDIDVMMIDSVSTAGNIFTWGGAYGLTGSRIRANYILQRNTAKRILYLDQSSVAGSCYDTTFEGGYYWMAQSGAPSVSPIYVRVNGTKFNNILFQFRRAGGNASATAPFFDIAETTGSAYLFGNTYRNINFEFCNAGCIHLGGHRHATVENCAAWDLTTTTGDLWKLTNDGASGNLSRECTFINVCRTAGTLGGGLYDINDSSTGYNTFINCSGTSNIVHDMNQKLNTIISKGTTDTITAGDWTTILTGNKSQIMRAGLETTVTQATYTVARGENGTMFKNTGASSGVEFDLPAAVRGLEYEFAAEAAQVITVDPNGTEVIRGIDGTAAAAGEAYVSGGSGGEYLHVRCYYDGVWQVVANNGFTEASPP